MADDEPDYGELQHKALLRILLRVAGGAPLQAAASHEGAKAADVLELALHDYAFARVLLIAQNERAYYEDRERLAALERVEGACSDVAMSVGQWAPLRASARPAPVASPPTARRQSPVPWESATTGQEHRKAPFTRANG